MYKLIWINLNRIKKLIWIYIKIYNVVYVYYCNEANHERRMANYITANYICDFAKDSCLRNILIPVKQEFINIINDNKRKFCVSLLFFSLVFFFVYACTYRFAIFIRVMYFYVYLFTLYIYSKLWYRLKD